MSALLNPIPSIPPSGELLKSIPAVAEWDSIAPWLKGAINYVEKRFPDSDLQAVNGAELKTPAEMQQFKIAALAADWLSYTAPADQAEFPRLSSVIEKFPSGFRVYFAKIAGGDFYPVGYTGWYPVSDEVFATLHKKPSDIKHRGFMKPVPESARNNIYLFNYSVAPYLIGTEQSGALIKDFAQTIAETPKKSLSAVTVSEHGASVAKKFGMTHSGQMTHDGDVENVYTRQFDL